MDIVLKSYRIYIERQLHKKKRKHRDIKDEKTVKLA